MGDHPSFVGAANDARVRDARCARERHPDATWVRRLLGNGSNHITFYCPQCQRSVTKDLFPGVRGVAVTAAWLREHVQCEPDDLPWIKEALRLYCCQWCGSAAQCEFHHVAPQAVFGEDAERFPLVPLCRPCHQRVGQTFEDYIQKRIRMAFRGDAA